MRGEIVPDRVGFRISVDQSDSHSEFSQEFCRATDRPWLPPIVPTKICSQLWHSSKEGTSWPRLTSLRGGSALQRMCGRGAKDLATFSADSSSFSKAIF